MKPVLSKNFGLKGGTLDATEHVERVKDQTNMENKPPLHRIPTVREYPHEFIHYPTAKKSCVRCGRLKDDPIHKVQIRIKNG